MLINARSSELCLITSFGSVSIPSSVNVSFISSFSATDKVHFVITVYSNSMFGTLNAREGLRRRDVVDCQTLSLGPLSTGVSLDLIDLIDPN